jgi:type III restriction enzyme
MVTKGRYNKNHYSFSLLEARLGKARIRVTITDINGKKREPPCQWLQKGETFELKDNKDIRAKDFTVSSLTEGPINPSVLFSNGETIYKDKPYSFDGEPDMGTQERSIQEGQTKYPVFNFVTRTARATSLTRPTIISIFNAIDEKKKTKIITNPEGFTTVFIETIKEQVADHIASRIEYSLSAKALQITELNRYGFQKDLFVAEPTPFYDIEEDEKQNDLEKYKIEDYFPMEKDFPQRELIDGSDHSLYTKIQKDSDVEERFVKNRVQPEDTQGKILCYFKFPANFKIYIPKILGKYYNPDWGIVRLDKDGKTKIQLVRETKGTEDTSRLRFSNERRKIECAKKHFKSIGISYRPITDKSLDWWMDE